MVGALVTLAVTSLTPEYTDFLMSRAIDEARSAAARGEVPVGAVIARGTDIIAAAGNRVEETNRVGAHAEMLVIEQAGASTGNWRLTDSILCVTLEPCTMCLGAIRLARIPVVIFGASDPRMGAVGSLYDLSIDDRLGATLRVIRGIREAESQQILKDFFESRRREQK